LPLFSILRQGAATTLSVKNRGEQRMLTKSRKTRRKRPNRQNIGLKNPIIIEKSRFQLFKKQEKWQILRVIPAGKIQPSATRNAASTQRHLAARCHMRTNLQYEESIVSREACAKANGEIVSRVLRPVG
jgi:hypothetical protein